MSRSDKLVKVAENERDIHTELTELIAFQEKLIDSSTEYITFYFSGYGAPLTLNCPKGFTWKEFMDFYPDQTMSEDGDQMLHMGSDGCPIYTMFYVVNSDEPSAHVSGVDVIVEGATYTVSSDRHPDTM